jgi:hypothetical protein
MSLSLALSLEMILTSMMVALLMNKIWSDKGQMKRKNTRRKKMRNKNRGLSIKLLPLLPLRMKSRIP